MTHDTLKVMTVALCALALSGCSTRPPRAAPVSARAPAAFDLADARTQIAARNAAFTRAHVTGDRAAIDAMFTDDAKVLPPGADPVVGRAAIDRLTAEYIAYGITDFREETTDLYGNAELLVDQGRYTMTYGKEGTVERGKYLNVWKFVDGQWKLHSNIWNANAPPATGR